MEKLLKHIAGMRLMILLLGLVLFLPFLGQVHLFDWDEINFAEAAREMLLTGDYSQVQIDFQPFWEKPPLFLWMQALCMQLLGVNEYAARFPNALCGILTLMLVFEIGRRQFDNRFGWLWAFSLAGSILPHLYFKSGIIDPWFNLLIFAGLYTFYLYDRPTPNNSLKLLMLSGTFIGLAVLTKGPVAVLIYALSIAVILTLRRFKPFISWQHLILLPLSITALGGLWFLFEWHGGRGHIVVEFIAYQIRLFNTQDAGHGGPFYYHLIVLLFGCFPVSAFALPVLSGHTRPAVEHQPLHRYMMALFWVVLILFSVVETKIIHYSSLCYLPLTYASAYYIHRLISANSKIPAIAKLTLLATGFFMSMALTALPVAGMHAKELISSGWIKDVFVNHNLMAPVEWPWYTLIPGIVMLALTIIWFNQKRLSFIKSTLFLSISAISIFLTLILLVPRIEGYTQNGIISFYKSLQDENVYVDTYNFKSYADLFYTQKRPYQVKTSESLMKLAQERPVYIVTKITSSADFEELFPDFERSSEVYGYVVYRKLPEGADQR